MVVGLLAREVDGLCLCACESVAVGKLGGPVSTGHRAPPAESPSSVRTAIHDDISGCSFGAREGRSFVLRFFHGRTIARAGKEHSVAFGPIRAELGVSRPPGIEGPDGEGGPVRVVRCCDGSERIEGAELVVFLASSSSKSSWFHTPRMKGAQWRSASVWRLFTAQW
ncbi:MAG: hypothetical protein NXI35_33170 [bacterium]|nr:hypothetical protein [bacterium]